MIKEIAFNKRIPAKEIAKTMDARYQRNPAQIYQLRDIDVGDVVRISYLLRYHLLKVISDRYLSEIPLVEIDSEKEVFYFKLDIYMEDLTFYGNIKNCDFLQRIHIGKHIRKFAEKRGWSQKYTAEEKLKCSQSSVSDLYGSERLTVGKLIQVSKLLKHNFIADVYLSRMLIFSSPDTFANCTITVTSQKVRIENPDDKTFLMTFRRQDSEK